MLNSSSCNFSNNIFLKKWGEDFVQCLEKLRSLDPQDLFLNKPIGVLALLDEESHFPQVCEWFFRVCNRKESLFSIEESKIVSQS